MERLHYAYGVSTIFSYLMRKDSNRTDIRFPGILASGGSWEIPELLILMRKDPANRRITEVHLKVIHRTVQNPDIEDYWQLVSVNVP